MIYKKIVNNVPSLSSLLLAGMVFGGCKNENPADNNAEVVADAPADSSSGSSKVSIDYTKLSDKQLGSFLKIAIDVFNAADLKYLKDKPSYVEYGEFVKIKDGSEAKVQLENLIKGNSGWGPKVWQEIFKKLSNKKVAGGGKGGDIQNKAGWVEGLGELIRPMSVFHEVYVQLTEPRRDINLTKLEEKIKGVLEEIVKEKAFDPTREFFNYGKHVPRSTASFTSIKTIIRVLEDQSENSKEMWLSKPNDAVAADFSWNSGLPADAKVKGKDSLTLPEIPPISITNNSQLVEVQLVQLFFDLFVGAQGPLSFIEITSSGSGQKYNVKLNPEAFAKLYDLAISKNAEGENTKFADELVKHINSARSNKYAIQYFDGVRSLINILKSANYKSSTAKELMDKFDLGAAISSNGIKPNRAEIIAYGTDAEIDASNHTFIQKLCNKVARSFTLKADSDDVVDGVNPILQLENFSVNGENTGRMFVDAIIERIIKPELNKLIVKIDVDNTDTYQVTPNTEALIGVIKDLGAAFAEDRTKDKITYADMKKVSGTGGFDVEVLSKIVMDAGTVFRFIFSKVPDMISGKIPASIEEIKHLISDANLQTKLIATIKMAQYDFSKENQKQKEAEEYNKKLEAKASSAA